MALLARIRVPSNSGDDVVAEAAVARILGRSPGAIRVAAHRGLRRLAQTLDSAGVTL